MLSSFGALRFDLASSRSPSDHLFLRKVSESFKIFNACHSMATKIPGDRPKVPFNPSQDNKKLEGKSVEGGYTAVSQSKDDVPPSITETLGQQPTSSLNLSEKKIEPKPEQGTLGEIIRAIIEAIRAVVFQDYKVEELKTLPEGASDIEKLRWEYKKLEHAPTKQREGIDAQLQTLFETNRNIYETEKKEALKEWQSERGAFLESLNAVAKELDITLTKSGLKERVDEFNAKVPKQLKHFKEHKAYHLDILKKKQTQWQAELTQLKSSKLSSEESKTLTRLEKLVPLVEQFIGQVEKGAMDRKTLKELSKLNDPDMNPSLEAFVYLDSSIYQLEDYMKNDIASRLIEVASKLFHPLFGTYITYKATEKFIYSNESNYSTFTESFLQSNQNQILNFIKNDWGDGADFLTFD